MTNVTNLMGGSGYRFVTKNNHVSKSISSHLEHFQASRILLFFSLMLGSFRLWNVNPRGGGWDVVSMMQGESDLVESREVMIRRGRAGEAEHWAGDEGGWRRGRAPLQPQLPTLLLSWAATASISAQEIRTEVRPRHPGQSIKRKPCVRTK